MTVAGFRRRLAAYLIDTVPLTLVVWLVFHTALGFDDTWAAYRADGNDPALRARFYAERNMIGDVSFALYLLYCTVLEASRMQGTLGKAFLNMRVTGPDEKRLSLGRSAGRNLAKVISYLPFGLGFLWVAFTKRKLAWHDRIAKTQVVHDEC